MHYRFLQDASALAPVLKTSLAVYSALQLPLIAPPLAFFLIFIHLLFAHQYSLDMYCHMTTINNKATVRLLLFELLIQQYTMLCRLVYWRLYQLLHWLHFYQCSRSLLCRLITISEPNSTFNDTYDFKPWTLNSVIPPSRLSLSLQTL